MSSNALAIREAIFLRLQTLPGYAKYRRVMTPQLQPDDLPCISASIVSETETSDGDENAGEPHFISSTVIGISVTRGFDDPVVLDGKIDADIIDIQEKLLADPTFVRFGPDALFEGVTQIVRRRRYPFQGETYFLELQLEITFMSRIDYPPLVESPFAGVTMATKPYGSDDCVDPIFTQIPVATESPCPSSTPSK